MRGVDQGFIRQLQQAPEQAVVLVAGVTVLEVCATGAADQQRVTGQYSVRQQETV